MIDDNWAKSSKDNFIVFNSKYDILYLIYTNLNYSIISYDIKENKKAIEIKNAHNFNIIKFRHYLDLLNKRELLISISSWIYNIKLWNIDNWECLYTLEDIYQKNYLYSSSFLIDNNQIYIIIAKDNIYYNTISEPIKVYDLNGNIIKEVNDSDDIVDFIDAYYDNKLFKNFIIGISENYIKSFDYTENKVYNKYDFNNDLEGLIVKEYRQLNITINILNSSENTKLINLEDFCYVKIWNFHTGELSNTIKINDALYSLCLWDNDYLFLGCDKSMKLLNLKDGKIIKKFIGYKDKVKTIIKATHPLYGDCLIAQAQLDEIKLWIIE